MSQPTPDQPDKPNASPSSPQTYSTLPEEHAVLRRNVATRGSGPTD
jgi:hypothetical protein